MIYKTNREIVYKIVINPPTVDLIRLYDNSGLPGPATQQERIKNLCRFKFNFNGLA
ncbi:hypothetical protein BH11BAC4_BH11BAC4_25100 [soil metagenome]